MLREVSQGFVSPKLTLKVTLLVVVFFQVEMDKTKEISLDDFMQIVRDYAEK